MWLLLKNLVANVVLVGALTWVLPQNLLKEAIEWPAHWGPGHFAGAIIAFLGALLYLGAAWQIAYRGQATPWPIDPPRKILIRGPYAWVRNPMYIALLLMIAGEAIFFGGMVWWLYLIFTASLLQVIVVAFEEPRMGRDFGAMYSDYCHDVRGRWLPRRPRPRSGEVSPR